MLDKNYLTLSEALNLLLGSLKKDCLPAEEVSLDDAYERVVAEDIISGENLPGFRRSTVDGYAVKSKDTFGASESMPVYLTLKGEVNMGEAPNFSISSGECARVFTGGMLPEGTDAVVMLEYAEEAGGNLVEILKPVSPWENVIREDEDLKKGEVIVKSGTVLKPQHIGALAGAGITRIRVKKRPKVGIVLTGDEVIPPEKKPKPGEVRDINSFTLWGLIKRDGGAPVKYGIVKDEYEKLKDAVGKAFSECDVVLVTGGTSAGTKDMTAKIISELGKPGILFHGARIKPGKPIIGAVCNNKPVFGLPGHPVAVFVTYEVFVKPVIHHLLGVSQKEFRPKVKAILEKTVTSQSGRRDFVRVKLEEKNGKLFATPLVTKSGLITSLSKADAILVVTEDINGFSKGDEVEVELL